MTINSTYLYNIYLPIKYIPTEYCTITANYPKLKTIYIIYTFNNNAINLTDIIDEIIYSTGKRKN